MYAHMTQSKRIIGLMMMLLALFILVNRETLAQDGGDVDIQDIYLPQKGGTCGGPSNGGRWESGSSTTLSADFGQFNVGPLFDADQVTGLQIGVDGHRIILQDRLPVGGAVHGSGLKSGIELYSTFDNGNSILYSPSLALVDGADYHLVAGLDEIMENRIALDFIADSKGGPVVARIYLGYDHHVNTIEPSEEIENGSVAYFILICDQGEVDLTSLIQYALGSGWKADWLGVEVVGTDSSGALSKTTIVARPVSDQGAEAVPAYCQDSIRVDVKKVVQ